MRADRIREMLEKDRIVLVAGFQGVSTDSHDVTTLGRGGSDTTAVALAAALGAGVCEIYTDVAGIYSADPRIVSDARKLPIASYEEMLEMSASGAKVLQLRSVEYARNNGVRIHCRSSFEDGPGTLVVSEEESEKETVEQPFVTAVTHSDGEARVTLTGVSDEPGVAGRIFTALADAGINVDVIIQNEPVGDDALADLSFTVDRSDLTAATDTVSALGVSQGVRSEERIGKVSIVGAGMRSHPGVAAKVFAVLGDEGINIEMISTSPIKISCVISADRVPDAVRALHTAFELGTDAVRAEDPMGDQHRPTVDGAVVGWGGGRGEHRHTRSDGRQRIQGRGPGRDRAGRDDDPRPARERATSPLAQVVPFASERSAGKALEWGDEELEVQRAQRGLDPGSRHRPLLGRRRGQRRVDAEAGRGRRGRRRQHQLLAHARRRAAGRRRGQPRRPRRPQGDRRQPELLDHADGRRAEAAL